MPFFVGLDQAIHAWFDAHRTTLGTTLMRDVTALGGHAVLTLVVLFTVGLLVAVRRRRTAVIVLTAVLGGVLLSDGAKALVGRARPEVTDPELALLLPHNPSFPSGHSLLAAVVYPTLALVVAGRFRRQRLAPYLVSSSLLLAFLVGLSRLYLGVHYFTDVVVGWGGGLTWALTCRWAADCWFVLRKQSPRPDEAAQRTAIAPALDFAVTEASISPQSQTA